MKFKRSFILITAICFILLYYLYSISIISRYRKVGKYSGSGIQNYSRFILDTPGCKIPKFDPFDESLKSLIHEKKKPYVCEGDPVFMIIMPNSTIILNETILSTSYNVTPENVSCLYEAIYREDDKNNILGDPKPLHFGVPLGEEFLKVQCNLSSKTFEQYIPLVPLKEDVEKRTSEKEVKNIDPLSVILIGIDSVSKLNFLRHFKKTHQFLRTEMSAFDMKGYIKVGENTFPNLVPLLTGQFVEYYYNESLQNTMFFDHLDFIWKEYSEKGYRTFYAEDWPFYGTFQYLKKGFINPPTDYYFRPLSIPVDKGIGKGYCLNNQLDTEILFGYLRDFSKTMLNRPYFAFVMVNTLTHNHLNEAGYADEPTYNLLKDLWVNGAMNRSIVVIFSDHGIRFGDIRETYIGKFEERMPFMYLSFPKWFLEKHGDISKNLKVNQKRIITLFDIHRTLQHLLDLTNEVPETSKSTMYQNDHGLSVLNEISDLRTCETADILPHFCPCQIYEQVSLSDTTVMEAADAIVEAMNRDLKPQSEVCATLTLDKITDARFGKANTRFWKHRFDSNVHGNADYFANAKGGDANTIGDYLITLRTWPGEGMFEGTVRYYKKNQDFEVLGVSRINAYKTQSLCITSPILRKFCFCKSLKPSKR